MKRIRSLIAVGCICLSVASTRAVTFIINSTGDETDANPGDGICETSPGNSNCTLRAAIQEINANSDTNTATIIFAVSNAVNLSALDLPPIMKAVTILGSGEINGSGSGGLDLRGGGSTVQQVTIHGCQNGIVLRDKGGNLLFDCLIGTDPTGTIALGNVSDGVLISNSSGNAIEGTASVISGNGGDGVHILGANSANNEVQFGILIGTDALGTIALGNARHGVHIENAPNNTVGGIFVVPQSPASVLVSGNQGYGILIEGSNAVGNFVLAPSIGTDLKGFSDMPNALGGLGIFNAPSNFVEGVLCSGNGGPGILIQGASAVANRVLNSVVGAGFNANALGNTGAGVVISSNASANIVEDDLIAFNGGAGVSIVSGTNNFVGQVLGELSIFSNGGLGIDLGGNGVTANHVGGALPGPNHLQNHPVLTSALVTSSNTTVSGTLNGAAFSLITIELYASDACDPSGFGEGQHKVGSSGVFTDASGNGSFNATIPVPVANGQFLTATATDLQNNTSEFSACLPVGTVACTLTCPDDVVTSVPAGQTNVVVHLPLPMIPVTCTLTSLTSDPPTDSPFPAGTNLVTYTAVDSNGNTNTCTFNVIVAMPDLTVQAQLTAGTCTRTTKATICPLSGSLALLNNGVPYVDLGLAFTQTCKAKKGITTCSFKGAVTINTADLGNLPDHHVAFYLSSDQVLDSSDALLYTADVNKYALALAKLKALQKTNFTVPKNVDLNGKFLIIVVNSDHLVAENNTANNTAVVGPLP